MMLLDHVLPEYDFSEIHSIRFRARPQQAFNLLREITPAEVPLFRFLLGLRALPMRLSRRMDVRPSWTAQGPLLEQMIRLGFLLLAEEPNRELVLGTIGQFWSLRGGNIPRLGSGEDFVGFDRPGYAKAAMNFRVAEIPGTDLVSVSTETRVQATDFYALEKFRLYWGLISTGSGFLRKMMLRAVRRRAREQGDE